MLLSSLINIISLQLLPYTFLKPNFFYSQVIMHPRPPGRHIGIDG